MMSICHGRLWDPLAILFLLPTFFLLWCSHIHQSQVTLASESNVTGGQLGHRDIIRIHRVGAEQVARNSSGCNVQVLLHSSVALAIVAITFLSFFPLLSLSLSLPSLPHTSGEKEEEGRERVRGFSPGFILPFCWHKALLVAYAVRMYF